MKIGEFLSTFRERVKEQNNGKVLSVAALSAIINIKADTLRSAEKGFMPRQEIDRKKLKSYFAILDLEDIQNDTLELALKEFDLNKELTKATSTDETIVSQLTTDSESIENNLPEQVNELLSSPLTKNDKEMINKVLDIIRQSNDNTEITARANETLARANEKNADANLILATTLRSIVANEGGDVISKAQAK